MKFVRFLGICTAIILSLAFMIGAKAETTPDYNGVYTGTVWNSNQVTCKVGVCYNYTGVQTGNTTFNNTKQAPYFNFTRGQNITVGAWIYLNKIQGATEISPVFAEGGITFGVVGQKAVISYIDSGAGNYGHNTTALLSANTWYYIVYNIKFGSTGSAQIYVNGVNQTTSMPCGAGSATNRNNTEEFHVGGVSTAVCGGVYTTVALNASVDELGVWNKTFNQSDINSIYQGGSGTSSMFMNTTSSNFATGLLGMWFYDQFNIFQLTATNVYNGTSITSFNSTVNGTVMFTDNGTIVTNISTNSSSLINFTVSATNYFTNTTNTNYNITTSPTAYLVPYTAIRVFNSTGSTLSNFTLNYTNVADSSEYGQLNVTDGLGFIPLYSATYQVDVYNVNNNGMNYSSGSTNLTANPYLSSYNFTSYFTNTINFTFWDESSGAFLSGILISAYLTSDIYSTNFTTNTGSYSASLLQPADYVITYTNPNYTQRKYYYTLNNQSTANLRLFLLNTTVDDLILINVQDTTSQIVSNALVKLSKRNLSSTNSYLVDTCITDNLGQCLLNAELYYTQYEITVEYPIGTTAFNSDYTEIKQTTLTIIINTAGTPITDILELNGLEYNITNSTPNTFELFWNDPYGNTQQVCLKTDYRTGARNTRYNDSCTSTATGTLTQTINVSNYDEWIACGYVTLNDDSEVLLDCASIISGQWREQMGTNGLFLFGFLLIGTMIFTGLYSLTVALTIGIFGVFLMNALNFINIGTPGVLAIVVVGAIIIYLLRLKS